MSDKKNFEHLYDSRLGDQSPLNLVVGQLLDILDASNNMGSMPDNPGSIIRKAESLILGDSKNSELGELLTAVKKTQSSRGGLKPPTNDPKANGTKRPKTPKEKTTE